MDYFILVSAVDTKTYYLSPIAFISNIMKLFIYIYN